jgi:hypothetical protein
LLDENMPIKFELGSELDVVHIESIGGEGSRNGKLIQLAGAGFDALISLDRGLIHQHHHMGHKLVVAVIRVPDSRLETIAGRAAEVAEAIRNARPGDIFEVPA